MKNIEKYAKEILGFACSVNDRMAVRKATGKPCECADKSLRCEECVRNSDGNCGDDALYKWAMAEYIEQPKISKKDRAFLDYLKGYEYMTRDDSGKLYVYISTPIKRLACACWGTVDTCKSLAGLDIDFPMVKWSDDEPWKIDDLKKLEVCDEYGEDI